MAHIKNAANFTKNKKRGGAQAYIVSVLTRVLPMVERSKLRTTCCFGWTRWTLQPASKLLQARSELERHSYFKFWIFWKTGARLLKFLLLTSSSCDPIYALHLKDQLLELDLELDIAAGGGGLFLPPKKTKQSGIILPLPWYIHNCWTTDWIKETESVMVARLPALPLLLLSAVLNAQLALVISTAETVTASVPSSPSSYSSSQSQLKYE